MKIRKMQNAGVIETPHVDLPYQASPYKSEIQNYYSNIIDNYGLNEVAAEVFRTRKGAKNAAESDAFMGVEKTAMEDPDKLFFNHIYDKKYDKHIEEYDRNYRKWHKKWNKFKAQEPGVYVSKAAEAISKGEIPVRYFDQRYMPEIQRSYEYQTDPDRVTDERFLNAMSNIALGAAAMPAAIYTAPVAWKAINNPISQALFTGLGIYNAFTGNGVAKTYNHFKNGEIWNGTKSLVGDILDIGIPGAQGAKAIKLGKEVYNTTNNASDALKYGLRELPIANLFQGKGYQFGKELFLNPEFKKIHNIPIYHGTDYFGDNFVLSRPEPGLHVGLDRIPADTRTIDLGKYFPTTTREGYYTYWGNVENIWDSGNNNVESIIWQDFLKKYITGREDVNFLRKLEDGLAFETPFSEWTTIPGGSEITKYDPIKTKASSEFIQFLQKKGIDALLYKNRFEKGYKPSAILLRPNGIHLSKSIPYSVTPKNDIQWSWHPEDVDYFNAILRGDIDEAKRLRVEHFIDKTPGNKMVEGGMPITSYHGTNQKFTIFDRDNSEFGILDPGYYSVGNYFTPSKSMAEGYAKARHGDIVMSNYLYSKNPLELVMEDYSLMGKKLPYNDGAIVRLGSDGVNLDNVKYDPDEIMELVVPNSTQIKSTAPITYDDAGNIIPLSKRDDFTNPDIRYAIAPTLGLSLLGLGND